MILARASQIIDCILQRYRKTRKNALFSWQPLDIRAKERDLSQKKNKKKRAISNDENKINNNNSNDNSNINNNNIKMLTILMILITNFS